MRVLMVSAEMAPFAKEGGLGDTAGALSKVLSLRGHEVRAVMPLYAGIDRAAWRLRPSGTGLPVPMGRLGRPACNVFEGVLPGTKAPVYFIEYAPYFGRPGIYNELAVGYPDNGERFVFLSRASMELCRAAGFSPQVVHVHDWHTAAVPLLLDTAYRDDPVLGSAASLLTLHNLSQQGIFDKRLMDVLDIGWEPFRIHGLEFYDRVNLLKGGIYHATLLNTVSPSYAREILQPEFSYGIEGVLREREGDLSGILNGADYGEWDPETDERIAAHYSETDLAGKALCKGDLQRSLGLPVKTDVALLGMVSRLVGQKGIDLLAGAVHRLLEKELQIALLGSGEPWAHAFFEGLARERPDRFACRIGHDEALAHKIIAGADFFLMPSRFEPCGLTQMYAMRYGTLPIVRATGGLNDTVEDADETASGGTGFKFLDPTPEALLGAVGRALQTFRGNPAALRALIRNAMGKRFTWEEAMQQYEHLYRMALQRKRKNRRDTARAMSVRDAGDGIEPV